MESGISFEELVKHWNTRNAEVESGNCKHKDTAREKTLDEIVKESAEQVRGTNCIAVIIADEETWARKG